MTTGTLPPGARRFALAELPAEPWRNGGGLTRVVAVALDEAGEPLWRVSAADIVRAAPFSIFAGQDRIAVLIGGERLALEGADGTVEFERPGSLAAFPGERALAARAPARPARLWNVMVRRGRVRAEVRAHRGPEALLPAGADALLFVAEGEAAASFAGGFETRIPAGEGLVLRGCPEALRARAHSESALFVSTVLRDA